VFHDPREDRGACATTQLARAIAEIDLVRVSWAKPLGILLLNGALAVGAATHRAFAQDPRNIRGYSPDSISEIVRPVQPSPFDTLRGVGRTTPLEVNGRFEIPFGLRMLPGSTTDRIGGTTRYQEFDGQRMLLIVRATAERILYKARTRDAVLTLRPDPSNPKRILYAARLVENLPQDVVDSLASIPTLNGRIDKLLGSLTSEHVEHLPEKFEGAFEVDSMNASNGVLFPIKADGKRGDSPVRFSIENDDGPRSLLIGFKGYRLSITLP
jgi:hypothetical protein